MQSLTTLSWTIILEIRVRFVLWRLKKVKAYDGFYRILMIMWTIEQNILRQKNFETIEYFWKARFHENDILRIEKRIRSQSLEADNPHRHLVVLGLLTRLGVAKKDDWSYLVKLEESDSWTVNFSLIFYREYLVLLHVFRLFGQLVRAVPKAFQCAELPLTDRELFCDFYFQGTYFTLRPKIPALTLEGSDIDNLEGALAQCQAWLGDENPRLAHYKGILAALHGDIEQAVEQHVQANSKPIRLVTFLNWATNLVSLSTIKGMAEKPPEARGLFAKVQMVKRHSARASCTLVACDQPYFDTFFELYAASFGYLNPGGLVHVHAIGFMPESPCLDKIEHEHNIKVNITYDPMKKHARDDLWKGYCAGARFLYLPWYLDHYDCVLVTDIDGILCLPEKDVWEVCQNSILVNSNFIGDKVQHFQALWTNIAATAVALANTQANRRFANAVSNYLWSRYQTCKTKRDEKFFFSDQTGLFLAYWVLRNECSFKNIPRIFRQESQVINTGRWDAKVAGQKALLDTVIAAQGVAKS